LVLNVKPQERKVSPGMPTSAKIVVHRPTHPLDEFTGNFIRKELRFALLV
jgi:hypothetical protein